MQENRLYLLLLLGALLNSCVSGHQGGRLTEKLIQGESHRIVVYGTSLTALPWSTWAQGVQRELDITHPGQVEVINSGQGSMWSTWGVDNLEERVIAKKPDSVIIEFGINDAYLDYKTSDELARSNLENMIDRILGSNPEITIILMTMNPPIDIHLERRPNIDAYYQMYRDVARDRNFLLIDHHKAWLKILKSDKELFDRYVPDGIHPGPEGCAEVITPAILQALGFRVCTS